MSWDTQIVRVSTGFLNTVNDAVIGGVSGVSGSKFAGQLGKAIWVDSTQIATMFQPGLTPNDGFLTPQVLYGGGYRYVQFSDDYGDDVTVGTLLYWDQNEALGSFIVTDRGVSTTLERQALAGFVVSPVTPGNYGFVQFAGIVQARFADGITGTKATGRTVFAFADGVAVDILDDLTTSDGAPLLNQFIGWTLDVPADNVASRIEIARHFTTRQ